MPQAVAAAVIAIKGIAASVSFNAVVALTKIGIGKALASAIVTGAGTLALNAGVTLAANALLAPKVGASGNPTDWQANPDAPIPFIAGRAGVGGQIVHRDEYGPNNMYQTLVTVLSGAGPIQSYVSFTADDQAVTFTSEAATTSQWSGEMWMQTRRGLQPETAHTSPAGLVSSATLPNWGPTYKLSGKASTMLTLAENSKRTAYPTGEPRPIWIVEGLYGYDPRLDSTYPGGAGSCRLATPSTWVYLTNPILWALKWALGLWEGPTGLGAPQVDFQVGGIGAKSAGIDFPAFVEAANVADANGWIVAAVPTTDDDKAQVLDAFLQAGGAVYAERAGKISCIHRGAARSSIVTVTGDDTAGPIEYDAAPSRINRVNTIRPRFWSEANRWQMTAIDEATYATWRTEDGGTRTRGVDFPYVPAANQAKQLALLQVAHTREPITGTIPLKPYLQGIKPGDCFTITEPGAVLNGVKCLAMTTQYDAAESVHRVSFVSETDSKYTIALGATGTAPTPPTPDNANPTIITPPGVTEWALTAGTVTGTDGAVSPVLILTGAVTNLRATEVIFEYRLNGATDWRAAGVEGPGVTLKHVPGVSAGAWQAAVSYRAGGNTSTRLTLGPVTVGSVGVSWTNNVSSRPANLAALAGSEGIQNSLVSISSAGVLAGAGGGTVLLTDLGGTVATSQIAADAVTATQIATGAVGSTEIAALAVTTAKIAADAVTAAEIATGAVGTAEIAASAVTTAKVAAGAITTAELGAGAVTAAKIAAATITATELATSAITTTKVLAGAVTPTYVAMTVGTVNWAASSAVKDLQSVAGVVVARGKVIIRASVTVDLDGQPTANVSGILRLWRGATEIFDAEVNQIFTSQVAGNYYFARQWSLDWVDDPGAGTYTYKITFDPGHTATGDLRRRFLSCSPMEG